MGVSVPVREVGGSVCLGVVVAVYVS